MPRILRVAAAQCSPVATPSAAAAQLAAVMSALEDENPLPVDLVAFPEGWLAEAIPVPRGETAAAAVARHPDWQELFEAVRTRRGSKSTQSRNHPLFVLLGSCMERCGNQVFATSILVGPDGPAGSYRKRFPDVGGGTSIAEGSELGGVFDVQMRGSPAPGSDSGADHEGLVRVRLGVAICFDFENKELSDALFAREPTIILNPVHIPRAPVSAAPGAADLEVSTWRAASDTVARRWERHMLEKATALVRIDLPQRCSGTGTSIICVPGWTQLPGAMDDSLLAACFPVSDDGEDVDPARVQGVLIGNPPERERTEWVDNSGVRWSARSMLCAQRNRNRNAEQLVREHIDDAQGWNLHATRTGEIAAQGVASQSRVTSVAFVDMMRVVGASEDGFVFCNNMHTGLQLWEIDLTDHSCGPAACFVPRDSPQQPLLVLGRGGELIRVNPNDGKTTMVAKSAVFGECVAGGCAFAVPDRGEGAMCVAAFSEGSEVIRVAIIDGNDASDVSSTTEISLPSGDSPVVGLHVLPNSSALVAVTEIATHTLAPADILRAVFDGQNPAPLSSIDMRGRCCGSTVVQLPRTSPVDGSTLVFEMLSGQFVRAHVDIAGATITLIDPSIASEGNAAVETSSRSPLACCGVANGTTVVLSGLPNGEILLALTSPERDIRHHHILSIGRGSVSTMATDGFRLVAGRFVIGVLLVVLTDSNSFFPLAGFASGAFVTLSIEQNRAPVRLDRIFSDVVVSEQ
jgi:predicted amidohydrolase